MDFIKKLLAKTSGPVSGVLCLCFIFIGFCSIVLANIGFEELFNTKVSWFIFYPLLIIAYSIPLLDVAVVFLSLYGGYSVCDKSTFAMVVFIAQCVVLGPLVITQILLYLSVIINTITGKRM
jgi:hypothetical protein